MIFFSTGILGFNSCAVPARERGAFLTLGIVFPVFPVAPRELIPGIHGKAGTDQAQTREFCPCQCHTKAASESGIPGNYSFGSGKRTDCRESPIPGFLLEFLHRDGKIVKTWGFLSQNCWNLWDVLHPCPAEEVEEFPGIRVRGREWK